MRETLKLSIDAMGGDAAPHIVVLGIERYLKSVGEGRGACFILHGDEAQLSALLAKSPRANARCEIAHTEKVIHMGDKPSLALRRGKGTSMWNAIASVKAGAATVAVSAGNTGALMAMSKIQLRMKPGVQRPAIAARWPHLSGGYGVVLDVGANLECDAGQLREFAVLGEAYFRALYKKEKPSIGLLNVGTEELKGNATVKEAHDSLSCSQLGLNYVGFVEGNDISMGEVDVIVTDGFTGNVSLKTAEGAAKLLGLFVKQATTGNLWSRITSGLNYRALKHMRDKTDPRLFNGGVFLGLNGIVIKSHGGTDEIGFASAVEVAVELADSQFLTEIERTLDALHEEDDMDIALL